MKLDIDRISASQLSELSGFDRRTVKAVMRSKPGPYSLKDFCAGVRRHYTGKVVDQRERRARVSADLLELELHEKVGSLIPTAVASYCMQNLALLLRSRFMTLPSFVAAYHKGKDMTDAEFETLVDGEVRKILEDASKLESYDTPQTSPGGTIVLQSFADFMAQLLAENPGVAKFKQIYDDDKATTEGSDGETSPAAKRESAVEAE